MKFREAQMIEAVGGLNEDDRQMVGAYPEMLELAAELTPRFKEACNAGHGIKKWWNTAKAACYREANSEMTLGFLLRKGIEQIGTDWYHRTPTVYRQYSEIAPSNAVAEWYGPLYAGDIAVEIYRGVTIPEGRVQGENSQLVNRKFGRIEAFERELFDDDKTGQIAKRASVLGESMAVTESVYASSRFIGAARTYGQLTVTASNYSTTNYLGAAVTTPWSSTLYSATEGNRPSSYGILNMGNMKFAYQMLMGATDPLGNIIAVNPNTLLHSRNDKVNADLLVQPGYYPATVGQSNTTLANNPVLGGTSSTAGTSQGAYAGYPGGIMSNNPIAAWGIKAVCEVYMTAWACALGQSGRGFVFQERTPLEVVQETPNSGNSFNFDVIRYRAMRRFEADWIGGGSRFWFLLNDGTVTGAL